MSTILGDIWNALVSFNSRMMWSPPVDANKVLTALAAQSPEHLDWQTSIVDLLKLIQIDSSLVARKKLAMELGYTGALDGSAEMNMWLHAEVMKRISAGQMEA